MKYRGFEITAEKDKKKFLVNWSDGRSAFFPIPQDIRFKDEAAAIEHAKKTIDVQYELEALQILSGVQGERITYPWWDIVTASAKCGISNPKDHPWVFAGQFDEIAGVTHCTSSKCMQGGMNLITLSLEEIDVRGIKIPVYLGQCKQCSTIYWGMKGEDDAD